MDRCSRPSGATRIGRTGIQTTTVFLREDSIAEICLQAAVLVKISYCSEADVTLPLTGLPTPLGKQETKGAQTQGFPQEITEREE
ncbi:hypothetical protein AV530_012480 [Patagioenas fasciata monilis]|uniref:Uncharacterized protein n=1 Tax=Patagioenas fasciata monilis TaxID=372326 RepID=A0A1V4JBG5_PATFA|nr:hypothetical protein AV530_012480 [Patagioenas fasciata monilis]